MEFYTSNAHITTMLFFSLLSSRTRQIESEVGITDQMSAVSVVHDPSRMQFWVRVSRPNLWPLWQILPLSSLARSPPNPAQLQSTRQVILSPRYLPHVVLGSSAANSSPPPSDLHPARARDWRRTTRDQPVGLPAKARIERLVRRLRLTRSRIRYRRARRTTRKGQGPLAEVWLRRAQPGRLADGWPGGGLAGGQGDADHESLPHHPCVSPFLALSLSLHLLVLFCLKDGSRS